MSGMGNQCMGCIYYKSLGPAGRGLRRPATIC